MLNLFDQINGKRNKLSHEIIRNQKYRESISKIEVKEHITNLIKLIELTEIFLFNFAKKYPSKFFSLNGTLDNDPRTEILEDIIAEKVMKDIDLPLNNLNTLDWGIKFKEEFKKKYKKIYFDLFDNYLETIRSKNR